MGFFQVSVPASRRARIRAALPTTCPAGWEALAAAVAGLPDPAVLGADELCGSLIAAGRLRNQVDAYLCGLAGAADVVQASRTLHAGTTGTLVAAATGCTPAAGSAVVATARALRGLPVVAEWFRAGDLSAVHVSVITRAAGSIPGFTTLEDAVVATAAATDPVETRRILEVIIDQVGPGSPGLDAAAQRERRSLRLSARPSGMWRLSGLLDEVAGSKLSELLACFIQPADTLDQATAEQRRADALDGIVDAAAANTAPHGVGALSVLVDLADVADGDTAVLTDGTRLSPAGYQLVCCAAVISVIVGITDPAGAFVPLALARTKRRASAAQWAALVARDRGCLRCGQKPRFCHAHHIIGWASGGLTDLQNLCLLCPRCHRDLHLGRYHITTTPGTAPTITVGPPPGRRQP